MPVESWTLPLYCSFGIVRLIRAASATGQIRMFESAAFRLSIEAMWDKFGRSHFEHSFFKYTLFLFAWLAFDMILHDQKDNRFAAAPVHTQLILFCISVSHCVSQVGLTKLAAHSRVHSRSVHSVAGNNAAQPRHSCSVGSLEAWLGHHLDRIAGVLWCAAPVGMVTVLYQGMEQPDVTNAIIVAPLMAMLLERTWTEIRQNFAAVQVSFCQTLSGPFGDLWPGSVQRTLLNIRANYLVFGENISKYIKYPLEPRT
eukprot:SAG11_NODE_1182_length_5595_cov_1.928311_3_plen_256_part_00